MTKNEFLEKLTKKLRDNHIGDIDEIVAEYEEHFAYKLADGYSEEEIAAKLGAPEALAEQFLSVREEKKTGSRKAITVTGLVFTDIIVGALFVLLFAWVAVMAVLTAASLTIGVCLIGRLNIYALLPSMPYGCGLVFALTFFALAILSGVGTIYCAAYFRQLIRVYGRFHKNCIASAVGKATLPPLAAYPQLTAKARRRLRSVALVSLTVFAVGFVAAYIVSALAAGALGFWHVWGWFVR